MGRTEGIIGENGANGNGIGDEGDDAHRSTATTLRAVPRADERQHIVDARDEGSPARGHAPAWGDSRRTGDGLSVELPRGRLLYTTVLTTERDDLIPQTGIGSQHPVIAVTVDAWRVDEQSEPLKELQRSEGESRGTIRCGMGKTIDDALASRRTVPGGLEPFEGERRTGTVAQESFEPSAITGGDVDRSIDAKPTGGPPGRSRRPRPTFGGCPAEVAEHAVAHRVLEFAPVGWGEMGGLVELDRALGILAEHAVDDTDVEMKVSVQRRAGPRFARCP